MIAVADTRLLLTPEFPPNEETKKRAEVLVQREIADALIASAVKTGGAEYVITDNPHYKTMRIKTRWM